MRRGCRVPIRCPPAHDLAQECNNVTWYDIVERPELRAEPERDEAIIEAQAGVDRFLRQSPLLAKIGLVLGAQAIECSRCRAAHLLSLGKTSHNESIDKAIEAEPFVDGLVGVHGIESRCARLAQRPAHELALMNAALGDRLAEGWHRI